jgi:hypothetical protein
MEPEMARLLGALGRPGFSSVVRQAWDSAALESLTKKGVIRVVDPHVSMIGHVTADELRRKLTSTDQLNGFANRFLVVASRRVRELPFGGRPPLDLAAPLLPALSDAVAFARGVGLVRRDEATDWLWWGAYPGLSTRPAGLRGAVTGRAEAQVMRLALVYALLERSPVIGEGHLRAALALWGFCERSAYYVWAEPAHSPDLDRLLQAVDRAGDGGLSLTAVGHKVFQGNKPKEEIHALIEQAIALGKVHKVKRGTRGRPEVLLFPGPGDEQPGSGDVRH